MHRLRTDELDYPLDPACVATVPAEPRDSARMMIVRRSGAEVVHARVSDLPKWLAAGDLLVANHTKVAPVRFEAVRLGDSRAVEGLFVAPVGDRAWTALVKGAKRLRPGDRIELRGTTGERAVVVARERRGESWVIDFPDAPTPILERVGRAPLPPYILDARRERHESVDEALDRDRYQTVYAQAMSRPSVAAPTAGLHLTPALLQLLRQQGVGWSSVELQVGLGTFKPVETEWLDEHPMHAEWCRIEHGSLEAVCATRTAGGRVIAVGTTSVRVLESLPVPPRAGEFDTRLLIAPGHGFRLVDGLLTNFHLPRSTLLALVGAMVGLERLKSIYAAARREGYRFYSYGDCMLILP
ncbi:MAG: tRNA preQ1(34) S-adenosylmethionine ribosyltransferase-isomerase QueA [Planctomycetes bacterium]|nr:tRNA preQ1(34) S-adenosylmethionine ribosyltransferase-isomerase QueA [Planctomycetota bacterium]